MSRVARTRLDLALLARGLAPSREKAQSLILAGRVAVDGQRADKPGSAVKDDAAIEVLPGDRPFASRGGSKLAPVLERLGCSPAGWHCIDIGASTGGFTDVLLRGGARHVTAVDVGHGLLDDALRRDPRVTLLERTNARYLRAEDVRPPYDLAVCDLSFISLTLVVPAVLPLLAGGRLLALVKPQFELSRAEVGAGGVVRRPELRQAAVVKVATFLAAQQFPVQAVAASPLAGPKGNREVFILATRSEGLPPAELTIAIRDEVWRDGDS